MSSHKLLVGPLVFDVNAERVILATRAGRHLTFHFDPQPSGRHAGCLTPHVTSRWWRRTLAPITLDRWTTFWDGVGESLFEAWIMATSRADLDAMALDGWAVSLPSDAAFAAWADRHLKRGERVYEATEDSVHNLADFILHEDHVAPVTSLDTDPRRERQTFAAMRAHSGTFESCWLSYLPGLGWCKTRSDYLPDDRFTEIMIAHSSPRLWRTILRAIDLLRLKADRAPARAALEKLERGEIVPPDRAATRERIDLAFSKLAEGKP